MNAFIVLIKKEIIQFIREMKIVWLPLVFIFLGATQPVISYYLPTILKAFGEQQGIIIDPSMTIQEGGPILASTLGSQFDQLGLIIIVVSIMGIVQSDKTNGMLAFILTRPVRARAYINSKVTSNYLFIAGSLTCGYLFSYGYTIYLFTEIHFTDLLLALFFYLLWVLFIVSFTTMISTLLMNQAAIAFISIFVLLVMRIIVGFHPILDNLNPASMSAYAMEILSSGTIDWNVSWSMLATLLLSALAINIAQIWISNKRIHLN